MPSAARGGRSPQLAGFGSARSRRSKGAARGGPEPDERVSGRCARDRAADPEGRQAVVTDLKLPDAPVGVPESFEEHIKLMFDLQVLALQADITRVSTLMFAHEISNAVYPKSGMRDAFHMRSHHSNIRAQHGSVCADQPVPRADAGVLPRKAAVDAGRRRHAAGSFDDPVRQRMSDGNQHNHDPLPIMLAGGASGKLQGGRHLEFPEDTPMSNLLLSMLDKLGVPRRSSATAPAGSKSEAAFQNCTRITSVPCRGVGVANVPAVAAAGLVPFPPTAAGLM